MTRIFAGGFIAFCAWIAWLPASASQWMLSTPFGANAQYDGAVFGPDNHIWFADATGHELLRYTERGVLSTLSTGSYFLNEMVLGHDGYFYATMSYGSVIVKVSVTGTLTPMALGQAVNGGMTVGSHGNVWVVENAQVGSIDPNGNVREYQLAGDLTVGGSSIAQQPGGSVWFDAYTPSGPHYLGSLDPTTGKIQKHSQDQCGLQGLPTVTGQDGRVWAVCAGWLDGFGKGAIRRIRWPANLGFGMIGGYDNAAVGPDGALWIIGADVVGSQIRSGAILRIDTVRRTFHKYAAPLGYEWESSFTFDRGGNIWAGTQNGQIQRLILHK